MMDNQLEYAEVSGKLLEAIPELSDKFRGETKWQEAVGGKPGQYDVVCFVLKPFLRNALASHDDPAVLKRIFRFLEDMALSSDIEVVNLLQVGIFESLVSERGNLSVAWRYMGEATKKIAERTALIRGCKQNLPPDK
jgi:hypothetical protein